MHSPAKRKWSASGTDVKGYWCEGNPCGLYSAELNNYKENWVPKVHAGWVPLGHPRRNRFNERLQKQILVLVEGFKYLRVIEKPGRIVDFKWTNLIEGGKYLLCKVGEG